MFRAGNTGFVALILGGLVLIFILVRVLAPGVVVALLSPLWRVGTSATAAVGNVNAKLEDKGTLVARVNELGSENGALAEQNRTLVAQNQDLQKLVGARTASPSRISAGVLARPPVAPYDVLIIGAGTAEGISNDAIVFADGGVPIGSIRETTAHSAQVGLFSTSGRSNEGWAGDTRIPITLMGAGAGAFTAKLPKDAAVPVGSLVFLPGPGALPVGTITKIDTDPSSPEAILEIQPVFNLFSTTWVEVARSAS